MTASFIQSDIPTFFNEFSQKIRLDGMCIDAVMESGLCSYVHEGAVERCDLQVHVRTADIPDATARYAGGNITIDGQNWCVSECNDDLGITMFRLVRGRGY